MIGMRFDMRLGAAGAWAVHAAALDMVEWAEPRLGLFARTDVDGLGEAYAEACAEEGVEPGMCVLPPPDPPVRAFVADDVDRAWDELGPHLLRNALDHASSNDDASTTASLSAATTVDALRDEEGAYRIATVDQAATIASTGSLTLHPMCGGIPPELARTYLRRVADEVVPALAPPG